jgi:hypothetical protein
MVNNDLVNIFKQNYEERFEQWWAAAGQQDVIAAQDRVLGRTKEGTFTKEQFELLRKSFYKIGFVAGLNARDGQGTGLN